MTKQDVIHYMGMGYKLGITHESASAMLISTGFPGTKNPDRIDVPISVAEDVIKSEMVTMLTEYRKGSRMGWRELHLDGTIANWWVMAQ